MDDKPLGLLTMRKPFTKMSRVSVPVDHHYLPQFYLRRWTRGGRLYRYVRPVIGGPVHQKRVSPAAIGYERDLYAYSTGTTEASRQRLERDFFQKIDDRAASAFAKIESLSQGSALERVGLVQFLLSLMHRSPSRLAHFRDDLSARMADVPSFDPLNNEHQNLVRDQTNDLLTDLISSDETIPILVRMKVYHVPIRSPDKLMTGDLPLMMSDGIARPDAFLMLPYAPDKLIILAHDETAALAFSTQDQNALVHALNDAVVRQARQVVIACDASSRPLIEEHFDPFGEPVGGDGYLRWEVP